MDQETQEHHTKKFTFELYTYNLQLKGLEPASVQPKALGCSGVFKNIFEIHNLMTVAQNQVLEAEELGPQ